LSFGACGHDTVYDDDSIRSSNDTIRTANVTRLFRYVFTAAGTVGVLQRRTYSTWDAIRVSDSLSIGACSHDTVYDYDSIRVSNDAIGIGTANVTRLIRYVFVDTAARRLCFSLKDAASVGRDESGMSKSLRFLAGERRTIDTDDTVRVQNR
jgi:hypothetical protein